MFLSLFIPIGILLALGGLVLLLASQYKKVAVLLARAGLVIALGAFDVMAIAVQTM